MHAKGVILCERKDVFLPSKHLLCAFYEIPSKNPSKNLVFTENPYKAPSKNPFKKHLLLENLLRTLLRSVLLHDPLVRTLLGRTPIPRRGRDIRTGLLASSLGCFSRPPRASIRAPQSLD